MEKLNITSDLQKLEKSNNDIENEGVDMDEDMERSFHSRHGGHFGCLSGTKMQRELSEAPYWDYSPGDHGPNHWADLCESWAIARTGKQQSPINLFYNANVATDYYTRHLDLKLSAKARATAVNNGHTVQVNWTGGHVSADKKIFEMVQFHFHSPSEHTVNGIRYPLEMHIVSTSETGELAVLGVLFKEGSENKFLAQFFDKLPNLQEVGSEMDLGELKVDHLHLNKTPYFRYIGSLTTPPFTEGVVWKVMEKVHCASPEQIQRFKEAVKTENARPLQPVNNRSIVRRVLGASFMDRALIGIASRINH